MMDRERLQSEDRDIRGVEIRRFELTAALSATGSNNARVLQWSRTDEETSLGSPFKVYAGLEGMDAGSGMQGYCAYMRDARRWEVITFDPLLEGVLDGDLEAGDTATVSIYVDGSDTSINITGVSCWTLPSGKKIVATSKVTVALINGNKRVIGSDTCPEDI